MKALYPNVVHVRIDPQTHRQIIDLAARERIHVSEMVRRELKRIVSERKSERALLS